MTMQDALAVGRMGREAGQDYAAFLASKAQLANAGGFEPTSLPTHLFDYQQELVTWAVRQGRAAIFADCGLGKTPMSLAWADQVHNRTGRPVLVLTPLAVGFQIVAEANRFGHDAALSRDGLITAPIVVTNYEQLGKFDPDDAAPVPTGNTGGGRDGLIDFPGDVIRAHQAAGWIWIARHAIWKEPLAVRNRTMQKNLSHKTICDDGAMGGVASADELLVFRKPGAEVPVTHPLGLTNGYAGSEPVPAELLRYRGMDGDQKTNRYSHWIWRRYASSVWDDIRLDRVLPFRESRDEDDEKHVHPLQLDVIERYLDLRTMPGERIVTPFMGVGSEVFAAVQMGRMGIGSELKPSYYTQALRNLAAVDAEKPGAEDALFTVGAS